MRIFWSAVITVVAVVAVEIVVVVILANVGAFAIGADTKDSALVHWFFPTVRDSGLQREARNIHVPPNLGDPAVIRAGAHHYVTTCEACHGAPGGKPSDLAAGMNPKPPQFATRRQAVDDEQLREWFVVADHGLRMTGMPAFGKTHSDDQIWSMVAFLAKLPSMSARDYATYAPRRSSGAAGSGD